MRNKCSRRVSVLLICGLSWTSLVPAQSQNQPEARETSASADDDAAPRTAVEWGHTGLKSFSQKRWNDAVFAFEKAETLAHSPVFLLYAARASHEDGRLLDAHRLYRKCVAEILSEGSPLPWANAVRDAQGELLNLEVKLSGATLVFSENWTMPISVFLPGGRVTTRRSTMDIVQLPGQHVIEVEDASGRRSRQSWWARAGEYQVRIQVSPDQLSSNTQVAARSRPPEGRSFGPIERLSSNRRGAVVAWSLGGAALVGAAVASGFAVFRAVELKNRCGNESCDREDEYLKYEALKNARLATAGLVVAGVSGAVGLTLWLIPPPEAGGGSLQAVFNPHGMELNGRF
jgi:hypothetical protein